MSISRRALWAALDALGVSNRAPPTLLARTLERAFDRLLRVAERGVASAWRGVCVGVAAAEVCIGVAADGVGEGLGDVGRMVDDFLHELSPSAFSEFRAMTILPPNSTATSTRLQGQKEANAWDMACCSFSPSDFGTNLHAGTSQKLSKTACTASGNFLEYSLKRLASSGDSSSCGKREPPVSPRLAVAGTPEQEQLVQEELVLLRHLPSGPHLPAKLEHEPFPDLRTEAAVSSALLIWWQR
jgi:hypothetical protein